MAPPKKNQARLEIRLDRETKEIIERAATIARQNLTDFTVSVLRRSSSEVIERHQQTVLSDRDRDIFLALLDADAEPTEALRRAADRASRE